MYYEESKIKIIVITKQKLYSGQRVQMPQVSSEEIYKEDSYMFKKYSRVATGNKLTKTKITQKEVINTNHVVLQLAMGHAV